MLDCEIDLPIWNFWIHQLNLDPPSTVVVDEHAYNGRVKHQQE